MTTSLFSVLLLLTCLNCAHAEPDLAGLIRGFFADRMDGYSRELAAIRPSVPETSDAYSDLYSKDTLTISIFIGVCESRDMNLVMDRPIREALIGHLTKDGPENYFACGFRKTDDVLPGLGATVLRKTQDTKNIVMKIYDSSVSEEYSACIGSLYGIQQSRSESTEDEYIRALGRDDIVLYVGHSRYGTGPGFRPLLLFPPTGVTVFIERPVLSRMCDVLEKSATPPRVLGFFSCQSEKYYSGILHAANPRCALVVASDINNHDNNVLAMLGFLDGVLGKKRHDDLMRGMNENGRLSLYRMYGLPGQTPHPHYRIYGNVLYVSMGIFLVPFLVWAGSKISKAEISEGPRLLSWTLYSVVLILSMFPALFIARTFRHSTMLPVPVFLSAVGGIVLCISLFRKDSSAHDLYLLAKRAVPFLFPTLAVYFCMVFFPDASLSNVMASLPQVLIFLLIFAAMLPFVFFSESVLLVPYLGGGTRKNILSLIVSLLFYSVVYTAMHCLGVRYTAALSAILIYAVYKHGVSLLLHRACPNPAVPVFFQTLTLAWIFTEKMHALMYS